MFAKKSLGQNWLNSPSALQSIIEAGQVSDRDTILEIGPGRGALTTTLLATGAKVIAVEKDRELIPVLQEKFSSEIKNKKLTIIEQDILDFDPQKIKGVYKLIANIPYYLTGQIIRKFLSAKNSPSMTVLLVQKEVADRIVAKDKKESLLSISVKIFGEPKYIKKVPAGAFRPIPKVDSAILLIDKINNDKFKKINISEANFFDLLHRGFAQKRKLLASNLKISPTLLTMCGVGEKARAENLTVENWLCLATKI